MSKSNTNHNTVNNKTTQTNIDNFVKYINNNLRMTNKYYKTTNPDNIEKYNNYLYFFAKANMKCMDKN
ncbi:putative ORFan [Tupanvirus deep ocean]|uniref:ORFan n=2 Tax=Tupanvirus TaxID=2094720 RepID=A0AC62A8U5_9VIRU|nr:putative ORFan [Tupanvirus deep ocean]QKU34190.1 putative ORFan [Tupanvirus deep ocean]